MAGSRSSTSIIQIFFPTNSPSLLISAFLLLVGLIFSYSDRFQQSGRKTVTDIHQTYIFATCDLKETETYPTFFIQKKKHGNSDWPSLNHMPTLNQSLLPQGCNTMISLTLAMFLLLQLEQGWRVKEGEEALTLLTALSHMEYESHFPKEKSC